MGESDVVPPKQSSYTEQTKKLAVEIVTQVLDGKDSFLSVEGRLAMIEGERQDALRLLAKVGPGNQVPDIADRLNVLTSMRERIIKTCPEARRMQRRVERPHPYRR